MLTCIEDWKGSIIQALFSSELASQTQACSKLNGDISEIFGLLSRKNKQHKFTVLFHDPKTLLICGGRSRAPVMKC